MQIKLLNDVVSEIAGKQASEIVELIIGKKDVNEFLIAKKLNLTINQIRNILYRLSNFGLVRFTRKKDKRKGWYTYFWTLNVGKVLQLLNSTLEKEITSLRAKQANREKSRFYLCNTCKVEVNEEAALLNNFVCPECGEVYALNEDKNILEELKSKIERLEKYKKSVVEELGLVTDKEKLDTKRKAKRLDNKNKKLKLSKKKVKKKKEKEKKKTKK